MIGLCCAELISEIHRLFFDDFCGYVDGFHFLEGRRFETNWADFGLSRSANRTMRCLDHSLRQTIMVGLVDMNSTVHYCLAGDEVAGN